MSLLLVSATNYASSKSSTVLRLHQDSGSTTIRLFRFDDHSDPNAIQGQLIETPLSDAPPYFALSYCWGAQVLDTPIQCNGAVMYITKALAQALRQINRHFRSQRPWTLSAEWIWIDQISINQGDVLERSQQVKLMGSIFSQSVQTLVWLGTKHDGCHRAWNLIDQIYQIVQTEHPNANYIADIPIRMFSLAKHFEYGLPEWKDAAWEHLRVLLRNPYFSRVWVIQEVALSPKDPVILHGYHEYSWEKLGWTASWLRRAGYLRLDNLPTQFHSIDTISNIRRSKVPWSLDALLVTTSMKFKATDQRDKVYGLLGIACETAGTTQWPEALLPDYELPIAQVYAKVAEFLISKSAVSQYSPDGRRGPPDRHLAHRTLKWKADRRGSLTGAPWLQKMIAIPRCCHGFHIQPQAMQQDLASQTITTPVMARPRA